MNAQCPPFQLRPQFVLRGFGALLLMLLYGATTAPDVSAATYSCDTAIHCYATLDWNFGTTGGLTSISLADANMNHTIGLNQAFINNELWVVDYTSPYCASPYDGCWVEGGWKATAGTIQYFWSDQRPYPNNQFYRHVLADVQIGEQYVDVQIIKWGGNQYVVNLHSQGPGVDRYFEAFSNPNAMQPHQITIGTEVYGSHDGYSHWPGFSYNQWVDAFGAWHPQTSNGSPFLTGASGAILTGNWDTLPDAPPYNGGRWTTYFEGR